MHINRATSDIPAEDRDIKQNVLYVGERTYHLNGRYKYWIQADVKINGKKAQPGTYQGIAENLILSVGKTGSVLFDRFPYPLKKTITPAPVAPVIQQDNAELRIAHRLEQIDSQYRENSLTNEQRENELRLVLNDLLDMDDSEENDLLINEDYGLVDLASVSPQEPSSHEDLDTTIEKEEKSPSEPLSESQGVQGNAPAST